MCSTPKPSESQSTCSTALLGRVSLVSLQPLPTSAHPPACPQQGAQPRAPPQDSPRALGRERGARDRVLATA